MHNRFAVGCLDTNALKQAYCTLAQQPWRFPARSGSVRLFSSSLHRHRLVKHIHTARTLLAVDRQVLKDQLCCCGQLS